MTTRERSKLRAPAPLAPLAKDAGRWGARTAHMRAIARYAAGLCTQGEVIAINSSRTTAAMAEFLTVPLTILTNSFYLAHQLLLLTESEVELTAGTIYRELDLIHSPFAPDVPATRPICKLFTGACGVVPQGVTEREPLRIHAAQRLQRKAHETIVLADSSRLAATGDLIMCSLSQIDRLITDPEAADAVVQMLERAGVKVAAVQPDKRKFAYH